MEDYHKKIEELKEKFRKEIEEKAKIIIDTINKVVNKDIHYIEEEVDELEEEMIVKDHALVEYIHARGDKHFRNFKDYLRYINKALNKVSSESNIDLRQSLARLLKHDDYYEVFKVFFNSGRFFSEIKEKVSSERLKCNKNLSSFLGQLESDDLIYTADIGGRQHYAISFNGEKVYLYLSELEGLIKNTKEPKKAREKIISELLND